MSPWLLTALLTTPTTASATPEILAPSGRWTVKYAENMCVLQRDYGTGAAQVTLGFRPFPLSEDNQLMLVTNQRSDQAPGNLRDTVSLRLGTGGQTVTGTYRSWRSDATPDLRYTLLYLDGGPTDAITAADTLTIERRKLPSISLQLMATPDALAALNACQDELLQGWGVDLAAKARVVTPAVPAGLADWVRGEDYPMQAIRDQAEGLVNILWTITPAGGITDCRVIQSSGSLVLDQASCSAISRRGRYSPALDKDGKPTRSFGSRTIIWRLPG